MSWHPCPKCKSLRKIDVVVSVDGWHQPACFACGDPEYFETHEEQAVSEAKEQKEYEVSQKLQGL